MPGECVQAIPRRTVNDPAIWEQADVALALRRPLARRQQIVAAPYVDNMVELPGTVQQRELDTGPRRHLDLRATIV